MSSPRDEYDLLLKAPNLIEFEMVQALLSEAGIPSLLYPVDSRGTFVLSHSPFDPLDLYVPKGMRDRAEQVLRASWSEEAIERTFPSAHAKEDPS